MFDYNIQIIENFFDRQDFIKLCEIAKDLQAREDISVYHNEILKDNTILKSSINKDFLIKLNSKYFSKAMKILEEINTEKTKFFSYSDFTFIKTKKNNKFPIHDDTPNKLLSGVIYLLPENNYGTSFYSNKQGKNKKIIEWKQNRSVFFSRKERETWHSYQADEKNDRIALVYNLMTNDDNIKKICQLENKSYLISKLRYKLNPYLFRYFNKLI